jgi:hypothetical protein
VKPVRHIGVASFHSTFDGVKIVCTNALQDRKLAATTIFAAYAMSALRRDRAPLSRSELKALAWCSRLDHHRTFQADE